MIDPTQDLPSLSQRRCQWLSIVGKKNIMQAHRPHTAKTWIIVGIYLCSVCLFHPLSRFGGKLRATSGISPRAACHCVCLPLTSSFCPDPSPCANVIHYQTELASVAFFLDNICFHFALFAPFLCSTNDWLKALLLVLVVIIISS